MIRKLSVFIIAIFLTIGCALAAVSVEKNFNQVFNNITPWQYNDFCQKIKNLLKENSIYVVSDQRNKRSAYFYGCDGRGERKTYIDITYQKSKMNLAVKITVDGSMSEDKASAMAYDLGNTIIEKSKTF